MFKRIEMTPELANSIKWSYVAAAVCLLFVMLDLLSVMPNFHEMFDIAFSNKITWVSALYIMVVCFAAALYSQWVRPIRGEAITAFCLLVVLLTEAIGVYRAHEWDWSNPVLFYAIGSFVLMAQGVMEATLLVSFSMIQFDSSEFDHWTVHARGAVYVLICGGSHYRQHADSFPIASRTEVRFFRKEKNRINQRADGAPIKLEKLPSKQRKEID